MEGRVERRAWDVREGRIGRVVYDGWRIGGDDVRAGVRDGIRLWRAVVELEGSWGVVVDLEVGREIGSRNRGSIDALPGQIFLNTIHVKVWNMSLEQSLALGQELFHAYAEAPRRQTLSVAVFLVADSASRCTGSTSGMFRVALPGCKLGKRNWNLPSALALIFLLLHRAHASCDRRSRRGSALPASSSAFRRRFDTVTTPCGAC